MAWPRRPWICCWQQIQGKGLVKAGGKQRTDSTHVVAAVRDLNRLELAGESVRACVEALAVAAPDWLAEAIDVSVWAKRYAARVDSWRLPTSEAKRKDLMLAYGTDAFATPTAQTPPARRGGRHRRDKQLSCPT